MNAKDWLWYSSVVSLIIVLSVVIVLLAPWGVAVS